MPQQSTAPRQDDVLLLGFVRDMVNSFVKWDLVRFFHDNPYAADTADNIARFTGRDARKVERELLDLVDRGVLEVKTMGSTQVFRFVKDPQIRDLIQRFVHACDDPDFRVRAINQVIEGLQ